MNIEFEIQELKKTVQNLQDSFIQAQINQIPVTENTDNANNRIDALTPYTETKTAYIGDTEVVFTGAKSGNLSVFIASEEGSETGYTLDRIGDMITVHFTEPLEYVTEVTISII